MDYLTFHTEELPQMAEVGARYVVVACCGSWRDGEITNSASQIPTLRRELRKRFMNRFSSLTDGPERRAMHSGPGKGVIGQS